MFKRKYDEKDNSSNFLFMCFVITLVSVIIFIALKYESERKESILEVEPVNIEQQTILDSEPVNTEQQTILDSEPMEYEIIDLDVDDMKLNG